MAAQVSDRDGKSKTASAADAEHYPEQNEVPKEHPLVSDSPDIENEVARMAPRTRIGIGRSGNCGSKMARSASPTSATKAPARFNAET